MAFDGAGNFNRIFNWSLDAANGVPITASRFDTEDGGFATGLSNCITRDGQGKPIADIDWNAHKIKNLADPSLPQDAVTLAFVNGTSGLLQIQGSQVVGTGTLLNTVVKYPQTAAELAAGVTPVNLYIQSHDVCGYAIVERYGTNTTPGTTDMKTAAQNAVNVALQAKCNVGVLTQCKLSGSVNIDRLVDGAAFDSYFRVVGLGEHAGFYATTAIAMFSTTIAFTTAPVTQLVSFETVNFEASGTGFDAYVLDDAKYLRTKFTNCDFIKIKCLYAPTVFCQSIYLFNCNIRRFSGIFFRSLAVNFDIKFSGNILEAGDRFAIIAFPVGCSVMGNLLEGCAGTVLRAYGAQGLCVHGNYFEQSDIDLDFTPIAAESSYGISVRGNSFNHTPVGGGIVTTNTLVGGAAYTNGTYNNVPLTGGNGFSALATIIVAGAVVTTVTITTAGLGYLVADTLSAAASTIGGTGAGFSCKVATITAGYNPSTKYSLKWGNIFNSQSEGNYGSWSLHNIGAATQLHVDDYAVHDITSIQNYSQINASRFSIGVQAAADIMQLHQAASPTIYLTDNVLGSTYGGAFRGYGVGGRGGIAGIGCYNAGVYTEGLLIDESAQARFQKRLFPSTPALAEQTASGLFAGTGVPSNANGSNGDFYFRSDGGALTSIYMKRTGAWVGVV